MISDEMKRQLKTLGMVAISTVLIIFGAFALPDGGAILMALVSWMLIMLYAVNQK